MRKGRERIERGILNSFYDLPENHQNIFIKIKEEVSRFFNGKLVYIYGSFLWGNWDEKSDYDVYVNYEDIENILDFYQKLGILKNKLENKLKVKIDIVIMRHNIGILIP